MPWGHRDGPKAGPSSLNDQAGATPGQQGQVHCPRCQEATGKEHIPDCPLKISPQNPNAEDGDHGGNPLPSKLHV